MYRSTTSKISAQHADCTSLAALSRRMADTSEARATWPTPCEPITHFPGAFPRGHSARDLPPPSSRRGGRNNENRKGVHQPPDAPLPAPSKSDPAKTDTAKGAQLGEKECRYPSECTRSGRSSDEPQRRRSVNANTRARHGTMRAQPAPENNAAACPARGPCQACTRTLAYHGQPAVPPSTRHRGTTSKTPVQHMRHRSTPPEHHGRSAPAKSDTAKTDNAEPAQLGEDVRRYPSECTRSRRAADEPQRRLSVNVQAHAKVDVATVRMYVGMHVGIPPTRGWPIGCAIANF